MKAITRNALIAVGVLAIAASSGAKIQKPKQAPKSSTVLAGCCGAPICPGSPKCPLFTPLFAPLSW